MAVWFILIETWKSQTGISANSHESWISHDARDAGGLRCPTEAPAAVMILFGAVQLNAICRNLFVTPERWDYENAVAFLHRAGDPSGIIAAGEFAFALGFDSAMVDDIRLGFFSGRRPPFIVASSIYRGWLQQSAVLDPAILPAIPQTGGCSTGRVLIWHELVAKDAWGKVVKPCGWHNGVDKPRWGDDYRAGEEYGSGGVRTDTRKVARHVGAVCGSGVNWCRAKER